MKADLRKHPEVVALEEAVARDGKRSEASKALKGLLKRLDHRALVSYRAVWIRERRDWKILTQGKVSLEVDTDSNQLTLILPERSCIQTKMSSALPLTTVEMRDASFLPRWFVLATLVSISSLFGGRFRGAKGESMEKCMTGKLLNEIDIFFYFRSSMNFKS
jgi:hypothetical protein